MSPDSLSKLTVLLSRNRHKTAISRTDYSRPIKIALADGLMSPRATVLDFGCGRGDDVRHLRLGGVQANGWDPVHMTDGELAPAEIVNIGYVINVIEDPEERSQCLERAWSHTERALIVSARLTLETPELVSVAPYGDGFVTSIPTFQKFYEQAELKDWIEGELSEPAVAAGPGVFYVFREIGDRMAFLASRYRAAAANPSPRSSPPSRITRSCCTPSSNSSKREAEPPTRTSCRAAMRYERGSDPCDGRFGSFNAPMMPMNGTNRHRPRGRSSHLPRSLEVRRKTPLRAAPARRASRHSRDLLDLSSGMRRKRDVALLAVGDMERVSRAARRSSVGKLTPSAIYVHESALESLHPLLRLYEGCARRYIGRVDVQTSSSSTLASRRSRTYPIPTSSPTPIRHSRRP